MVNAVIEIQISCHRLRLIRRADLTIRVQKYGGIALNDAMESYGVLRRGPLVFTKE